MREMTVATLDDLHILAGDVLAEVGAQAVRKSTATVLALHGELGAGKTTFVQSLAKILDVTEYVTSPTFVIMRLYPINAHDFFKKLVHIDAYRIESLDEIAVIGFMDILRDPTNLLCIEWAERIASALPADTFHITLAQCDSSENGALRKAVYGYGN